MTTLLKVIEALACGVGLGIAAGAMCWLIDAVMMRLHPAKPGTLIVVQTTPDGTVIKQIDMRTRTEIASSPPITANPSDDPVPPGNGPDGVSSS